MDCLLGRDSVTLWTVLWISRRPPEVLSPFTTVLVDIPHKHEHARSSSPSPGDCQEVACQTLLPTGWAKRRQQLKGKRRGDQTRWTRRSSRWAKQGNSSKAKDEVARRSSSRWAKPSLQQLKGKRRALAPGRGRGRRRAGGAAGVQGARPGPRARRGAGRRWTGRRGPTAGGARRGCRRARGAPGAGRTRASGPRNTASSAPGRHYWTVRVPTPPLPQGMPPLSPPTPPGGPCPPPSPAPL